MRVVTRSSRLATSLVCALSVPALATEGPGAITDLDRLQVTHTGTRIPRAGFDTLEPAQVISRENIERRNFTSLGEIMDQTPSFSLEVTPYFTQSSFAVGVSFASRFGLGGNRMLTLVNGRRFVSSNPPTMFGPGEPGNQVDLNAIPAQLIERVENMSIGGAPTYGSDAIGGVTNIILRDRFEGVEAQMGYGLSERGDAQRTNASSLFGTGFAGGRGHFVLALSHDGQQGVPLANRRFYRESYSLEPNPDAEAISRYQPGRDARRDGRVDTGIAFDNGHQDGVPGRVHIRDMRAHALTWGGLALPTGRSLAADPSGRLRGFGAGADHYLQFNPQGQLVPYDPGVNFGQDSAVGGEGVRPWEMGQIVSQLDRKTFYLTGRFDFNDHIRGFWEASSYAVSAREVAGRSLPNAGELGVAHLDGSGQKDGMLAMSVDHPLLTDQARTTLQQLGVDRLFLSRASRDVWMDGYRSRSNLWRVVSGLEGHFSVGGRGFDWEASGVYGRGDFTYLGQGLLQQNFINALNVKRLADGRVVCDSTAAGTRFDPACVPLDLFGEGRVSRQALDYVTTPTRSTATLEQTVFNANLTGEVIALPGGMMNFNAGYEFRREQGGFDPGLHRGQGLGREEPIDAAAGKTHSNEWFAEVLAPLVDPDARIPGLRRLDLTVKARRVINSVNGGFTAYTYGFQYEPLSGVQLRANKTRSFRSPSLVELYTNQSTNSRIDEPCELANVTSGRNPGNRAVNCAQFFAAYPALSPATFQAPSNPIPGRRAGNTELSNEQADAWTAGLVLRPDWAPGLGVAVDYHSIDLAGIIVPLDSRDVLSACFDAPTLANNAYCARVTRDPVTAVARRIDTPYVNGPHLKFRGWTAEASYHLDFAERGHGQGLLDVGVYAYFPRKFERVVVPGLPASKGSQTRALQWTVGYGHGRWHMGTSITYTPSHPVSPSLDVESRDYLHVDGYLQVAANLGYRFNDRWQVNLAVDNLTDNRGPFPVVYDALGRRYMLTAAMKL